MAIPWTRWRNHDETASWDCEPKKGKTLLWIGESWIDYGLPHTIPTQNAKDAARWGKMDSNRAFQSLSLRAFHFNGPIVPTVALFMDEIKIGGGDMRKQRLAWNQREELELPSLLKHQEPLLPVGGGGRSNNNHRLSGRSSYHPPPHSLHQIHLFPV